MEKSKWTDLFQKLSFLYDVSDCALFDAASLVDILEGVDLLCSFMFYDTDLQGR